ncbi:MAG: shikimate 5-dehydrogenase, partial [Clostridia bacterium]|nr:shikimate 5-dehydrogenase [Clostridia bacterium]
SKTACAVADSMECLCRYVVSRNEENGKISYETAEKQHSDAQVIINTTPVGMYPNIGKSPVDLDKFSKLEAVVDAVYNPIRSKLVCDAKKRGINAVGGLYMLVAQAAVAAEKFLDTSVPVSEIDRVYGEILSIKRNVVLTGMPGSGKSTIGKNLAQELSYDFYDTDVLIVKKYGKTIPEIFAEIGEKGFRKLESEVVFEISSVQGAVIATGGGVILNEENVDMLRENGIIYFIDRDINSIVATSDRPLSSNRNDLEKRFVERYPKYKERCDRHVSITNDVKENVQMIKKDFVNENTCD